jgi:uncharacterized protein
MPEFVDPWRLADRETGFSGRIALDKLPRLASALMTVAGEVVFDIRFSRDARHRACIRLQVQAELGLECQRCLQQMEHPVEAVVDLSVIEVPAEAERLPDEYEPVLVDDGRLRLLDLVEDELLLAIPQIPMHRLDACQPILAGGTAPEPAQQAANSGRPNPFAVLQGLKTDKQH